MLQPLQRCIKHAKLLCYTFALVFAPVILFSAIHYTHADPTSISQSFANLYRLGEQQCIQPSQHLDLMKASNAQLAQYGFPTHATIAADPKQWETNLANADYRSCSSASSENQSNRHIFPPSFSSPTPSSSPASSVSLSQNWAGYEAMALPHTFNAAQAYFTVPSINPSMPGDVSAWVGVGGDPSLVPSGPNGTVLVQAGLDACLGSFCGCSDSNTQCNTLWWEEFPDFPAETVSFTHGVHAGDQIFVYIDSNVINDQIDAFFMLNKTTDEYHSVALSLTGSRQYATDGASSECIVERSSDASTNGLLAFADFGMEKISGCEVSQSSGKETPAPIGSQQNISKIDLFSSTQIAADSQTFELPFSLAITGSLDSSGQDFDVLRLQAPTTNS
jgi:hypothetical protein